MALCKRSDSCSSFGWSHNGGVVLMTKRYEYRGRYCTVKELSELSGIERATIRERLRRGYSVEEAVKLAPLNESVEQFTQSSWWEDWIGMSINDLHKIYWKWCVSFGYTPCPIQGFSRHLFRIYPNLYTVPIRKGDKYFRMIRKR